MKKLEDLMNNKDFLKEIVSSNTNEEVINLFSSNGVVLSNEDVDELAGAISTAIECSDEMDEKQLSKVSGGFGWWTFAIIGGLIAVAAETMQDSEEEDDESKDKPFWKRGSGNHSEQNAV